MEMVVTMGTAYIDHIDIASDGRVVVTGSLSRTGLRASLSEYYYLLPPADGIWEYELSVVAESPNGAAVLVPFSVEAPWTGDSKANGARVYQASTSGPAKATTQLKAKKVEQLTTVQVNAVYLEGASYDNARQNLIVDLSYGGGCFAHTFELEWDGAVLKSNPPHYLLNLVDTSPIDPCEAYISTQLRFDLSVPGIQIQSPSIVEIRTPSGGQTLRVQIS